MRYPKFKVQPCGSFVFRSVCRYQMMYLNLPNTKATRGIVIKKDVAELCILISLPQVITVVYVGSSIWFSKGNAQLFVNASIAWSQPQDEKRRVAFQY